MKRPLFPAFLLPLVFCVISFVPASGQSTGEASSTSESGTIAIRLGGKHFTTLELKAYRRPILFPVLGPDQTPMTRSHPMQKGVAGEADDHPHHKSIWCGHGLINGVDFWSEKGQVKLDETKPLRVKTDGDSKVTIDFHANYLDTSGKLVCTDTNQMIFQTLDDGSRSIDWNLTIHASEGDLSFGDTKEGMMAIRTHPSLRIDKGAVAINSGGDSGKAIWGKKASWVDYSAKVEDKHVGVAIFDHPANLRHPTTWHARAYGLVAANPFGLHHFEGAPAGAGDVNLAKGESISWRYRFVFHKGDSADAKVDKLFEAYAK